MHTRPVRPVRRVAHAVAGATLVAAVLGVASGSAGAKPSCPTLARAIANMTTAEERARQAGNTETANYYGQTALYYQSLSDQSGCV